MIHPTKNERTLSYSSRKNIHGWIKNQLRGKIYKYKLFFRYDFLTNWAIVLDDANSEHNIVAFKKNIHQIARHSYTF